jgi:hypothetical protein
MSIFSNHLERLGHLHDSRVPRIILDTDECRLRLDIDDIYSNSLGLPEYRGPESRSIVLDGVSELTIQMRSGTKCLSIYEFVVTPEGSSEGGLAEIRFAPGGIIKAKFCRAEF